jgi:hypothetical protein
MRLRRFNEATEQETQEINDILNIARDEGYKVKYQQTILRNAAIRTPYVKIWTNGSDNFYKDMCQIYDRLSNLDYINVEHVTGHNTPAFFMGGDYSRNSYSGYAVDDYSRNSYSGYAYFSDNNPSEPWISTYPSFNSKYGSFFAYLI